VLGIGWTTKSNGRLLWALLIDTQTYSFVQLRSSGLTRSDNRKDSYPEALEKEIAIIRGTGGRWFISAIAKRAESSLTELISVSMHLHCVVNGLVVENTDSKEG
jgi:hypothetical protein